MSQDRKTILLRAAFDLLRKQELALYTLDLLEQTIYYDDVNCDGACLLDDIATELDLDREAMPLRVGGDK